MKHWKYSAYREVLWKHNKRVYYFWIHCHLGECNLHLNIKDSIWMPEEFFHKTSIHQTVLPQALFKCKLYSLLNWNKMAWTYLVCRPTFKVRHWVQYLKLNWLFAPLFGYSLPLSVSIWTSGNKGKELQKCHQRYKYVFMIMQSNIVGVLNMHQRKWSVTSPFYKMDWWQSENKLPVDGLRRIHL